MKHLISLLLLITALLLTACSASQPQETTLEAVPESTANEQVCYEPYRTFLKKYEYDEFMNTAVFPKNFITYEDIQILGEFDFSVIYFDDYSEYFYSLRDANSVGFILYIDQNEQPTLSTKQQLFSLDGMTSMCSLPESMKDQGYSYSRGNLTYNYAAGKLIGINWNDKSTYFKLYGDLDTYPTSGKKTIMSQLLSLSDTDALAAFNELKQSLPTE